MRDGNRSIVMRGKGSAEQSDVLACGDVVQRAGVAALSLASMDGTRWDAHAALPSCALGFSGKLTKRARVWAYLVVLEGA